MGLVVFLCLMLSVGWAHAEIAPVGSQEPKTILILGDSISAAYGIDKSAGWVALLADRIDSQCQGVQVKNASVSGETTAGGLARLPALLEQYNVALLVIELGGNDGLRGLSPVAMQQNLERMITVAKQEAAQVVVLGMYIPTNLGMAYRKLFTNAFENAVEKQGVPYLPFFLDQVHNRPEWMQEDQIHPTAEAQPQLLGNAWQVLVGPLKQLCPE